MKERNIEELWKVYSTLLKKTGREGVDRLLEGLGERIIMCSASTEKVVPGCGPGGLVETSIEVTRRMKKLTELLDLGNVVASDEIIITGLLHNIGMIGDLERSYLIDQNSDWHRERGTLYSYNVDIPKMPVPHRSLCLIQHFGVKLRPEEWTAISLSGGMHREENRFYIGSEPPLALLLNQSRQWLGKLNK
jgi:hypothetical protein